MICSDQIKRSAQPEDLVTEVLREITAKTITVELVNSLEEAKRWNKLIRKRHYLKEHATGLGAIVLLCQVESLSFGGNCVPQQGQHPIKRINHGCIACKTFSPRQQKLWVDSGSGSRPNV